MTKLRLRNLNLRQLLTLTTIPLMLVSAAAVGLVSVWFSSKEVASHHIRLGEQLTETLARHSDLALLYESPGSVEETLESLMANPLVLDVRVTSRIGKVIAERHRQTAFDSVFLAKLDDAGSSGGSGLRQFAETGSAWLFSHEVRTATVPDAASSPELALMDTPVSETLGSVQLALSKDALFKAQSKIFYSTLFSAMGLSLVLILILLRILRRVSRPLEALADTMHDARQGVQNQPAQLRGPLEIQEIGETYNELMQTLYQREQELRELNLGLEARIAARTQALEAANKELEAFSYSVSHDLRAPLRAIDGFSQALQEDYARLLDDSGQDYLNRIRKGANRMGELIDDMLMLSRVTRYEMQREAVDMSALASLVEEELREPSPDRAVSCSIQPGMIVRADPKLLRIVIENLLGNAWKYTSLTADARIAFSRETVNGEAVFTIRDNGAGFDMRFADKLFGAFQRLHGKEFEGTGVGLATVQRILLRHGGRIWAEAELGKGASFHFTLPERVGDG